jgi:hypothetical protein
MRSFSNFYFEPVLVKLKKNQNLVGPTVSCPVRTTDQPCPDRADRPQTVVAAALPCPRLPRCRFPTPPSSTASGSYKGRPPSWSTLSSSSAFCPTVPSFLPPPSHHGQPTPASLRPFRPRPEHRATVYNHPAPQAVDYHPRTPPPPPFPSSRPHLTVELVLSVSSSFPPPQNGTTTLPTCSPDPPSYTSSPSAAGIQPGRHQCRRSRAPPLAHRDGPPAQVAGPLG